MAFLLLGAGCLAAPMKLDGSAGKAILDGMTSRTENQTAANQTINQTPILRMKPRAMRIWIRPKARPVGFGAGAAFPQATPE